MSIIIGGEQMNQFYCREDELRKLNKRYADGKFECIVIYGRRRVGKTALINEFCKDKPTIFFSALNTTGKENLEALSKSIMSYERPDMESAPEFRTYGDALDELTALSKEKRIVFVIDEYPYLAKAKPAISAMLQHIIDHKWTESKLSTRCKAVSLRLYGTDFREDVSGLSALLFGQSSY